MSWSYTFSGTGAKLAEKLRGLSQQFHDEGEQKEYDAIKAALATSCERSPTGAFCVSSAGSASGPTSFELRPIYGFIG